MGPALLFAGATAGLDVLSGLFGYLASEDAALTAESRGRMLRMEAEAEAERYGEQARGFKATQKLAFLKSGVALSGSPLDILDETTRVADENISAIRAGGAARELEQKNLASQARIGGRAALLAGITGGAAKLGMATYQSGKSDATAGSNRKDVGLGRRTGYSASGQYMSPGYDGP